MMNRNEQTASTLHETSLLDAYYVVTEGCDLPAVGFAAIWNAFAPAHSRKAARRSR